ncbi:MAG: hypothetical protein HY608_02575 [Planctomycetes bacterium]|nr:hypothetical protein [Planctomycetota bacterium]
MKILLAEGFQRDLAGLPVEERRRVLEVMLLIPVAFRDPARHSGMSLRKLHPSGIWEVRVGLGLRILLTLEPDRARMIRVTDHDGVRAYLRGV